MNWTDPKPRSSNWPTLQTLKLPSSEQLVRRQFIGGSDANVILSGNPDRLIDLWLEKRGEKEPDDLSGRLPVVLGCWTEAFNRQWFEQLTGRRVSQMGKDVVCGVHPWRRCTLDGVIEATGTVWEAKHTNGFAKPEEVIERYMPQLQHNMAVTGYQQATLSVIFGNHKFEIFEIAADWLYQIELLDAEQRFWTCVQSGEEPVADRTSIRTVTCRPSRDLPRGQQCLGLGRVRLAEASRGRQTSRGRMHVDQGARRRGCCPSLWPWH